MKSTDAIDTLNKTQRVFARELKADATMWGQVWFHENIY